MSPYSALAAQYCRIMLLNPLVRGILVFALATGCSSGTATGGRDSGGDTAGSTDTATIADRADASADLGAARDMPTDQAWADLLDVCFEGLPAPVGLQVLANKSSDDGSTQVRLALDTMGKVGLSYAWTMVRLGIVIEGAVTCVTEQSGLTYTVTHHNCNDGATASAGTTRFELVRPGDTASELRIYDGSTLDRAIPLTTASCVRSDGPGACPQVGPC
jgi:hypothetical protein